MGAGTSRIGLPSNPSHLPRSRPRRRRSSITRTISSIFICGASRQMEDYQAELMVDSAELDNQGKLESNIKQSDEVNTKTSNNESASASNANQPSSTEIVDLDADNDDMSSSTSGGSSQVNETPSNSNALHSPGLEGYSLSSEVSPENNVFEANNSDSESSSTSSDSPIRLNFFRGDNVQDVGTSSIGSQQLERLQNSSESRWNGIRLLRDPFSGRNHWRIARARSFDMLASNSNDLGPSDSQNHDLSDNFSNAERQREVILRQSWVRGSNEQPQNQESEIQGVNGGSLDSTNHQIAACPRGIHSDGLCSCQPDSLSEEFDAEAGMSRVLLLAEALLQVLDQMHRQPLMVSLPTASSIAAPESVVDNFPVKIYSKANTSSECAYDVSQCYVCLDEYEEGDKIRVLPCNHEYHMMCVDKWLKEFHGVCPLCRGNVCEGLSSACDSVDNDEDDEGDNDDRG